MWSSIFDKKVDAQCLYRFFVWLSYNLVFSDLVRSYLENELVPVPLYMLPQRPPLRIAKYITDMATATFRKKN